MVKEQTYDLIDKLNPKCGLIGFLMVVGCFASIGLTIWFEWPWYAFGGVYIGILVPAKAIKIAEQVANWRFGGGGKGKK